MEILKWVEEWYESQCDGDWEHQYGIEITTVDNPGWMLKVDLNYTILEDFSVEYELHENSENDWFGFSVKNKSFEGVGDPSKLDFLLNLFKEFVLVNTSQISAE